MKYETELVYLVVVTESVEINRVSVILKHIYFNSLKKYCLHICFCVNMKLINRMYCHFD